MSYIQKSFSRKIRKWFGTLNGVEIIFVETDFNLKFPTNNTQTTSKTCKFLSVAHCYDGNHWRKTSAIKMSMAFLPRGNTFLNHANFRSGMRSQDLCEILLSESYPSTIWPSYSLFKMQFPWHHCRKIFREIFSVTEARGENQPRSQFIWNIV